MSENNNQNPNQEIKLTECAIDSIGVSIWQKGLAAAINETYSFANNSMAIYGIIPNYMRDYMYRYIRPCMQWLDGYVHSLHQSGSSGIISTKIGKSLITGLTKQVVGSKLLLKLNEEQPTDIDRNNLKKASKWLNDRRLIKSVYAATGWGLASGTSLLKANMTIDGKVWWEGVRFDQCTYRTNFQGEIEEVSVLIRNYVNSDDKKNDEQFVLVEKRYYEEGKAKIDPKTLVVLEKKGERIPMVVYEVQRVRGTMLNGTNTPNVNSTSNLCKWAELPNAIKNAIKRDYGCLRLDTPSKLPFTNLAVEPMINGNQDLSVPTGAYFGEGLLYEVQDDMIVYEVAESYKIRDMYNGKGSVYMPKSLSLGDLTNPSGAMSNESILTGMPDKIELMKGVDPEQQKAIVQQFEIRGQEWQNIQNDCIRNIATKWNMSPKVLSSYLANSTQMTATQVDSEDDVSIAFIEHTRSYFIESINRLLETSLNVMGIVTNMTITFASPSLVNRDRIIDRQVKLLEQGLTTIEDAIREIYPDLEEEQIQLRIKNALAKQKEIKKQQEAEMDATGMFGDMFNEEDVELDDGGKLGGVGNKGSTKPKQAPSKIPQAN